MTTSHITDHTAQALATQSTWTHTRARIRRLCTVLGDQVQYFEDVIRQVLVNSLLDNATGLILDEYGSIFDHPRGSLGDTDYRKALSVVMAAHQSDGTAKGIVYLSSLLIGAAVRYQVYPLAHYRLTYEGITQISGDWEARVIQILEILRPAGVSYSLIEGASAADLTFQFDDGPGFDQGRLARRIV